MLNIHSNISMTRAWTITILFGGIMAAASAGVVSAQEPESNACPVDGCEVQIEAAERENAEIRLTFSANFMPEISRNHIHVWWGENYEVRQVSGNAESEYGVVQGVWHPTDEYPSYVTSDVISTAERGDAETLCVTASDRDHNILDPEILHCVSVADLLD